MHLPSTSGGLRGLRVYLSGPAPAAAAAAAELAARGARVTGACAGDGFDALAAADVLALLPGWETSADSYVDVMFAQGAGIDFMGAEDLLGNA